MFTLCLGCVPYPGAASSTVPLFSFVGRQILWRSSCDCLAVRAEHCCAQSCCRWALPQLSKALVASQRPQSAYLPRGSKWHSCLPRATHCPLGTVKFQPTQRSSRGKQHRLSKASTHVCPGHLTRTLPDGRRCAVDSTLQVRPSRSQVRTALFAISGIAWHSVASRPMGVMRSRVKLGEPELSSVGPQSLAYCTPQGLHVNLQAM